MLYVQPSVAKAALVRCKSTHAPEQETQEPTSKMYEMYGDVLKTTLNTTKDTMNEIAKVAIDGSIRSARIEEQLAKLSMESSNKLSKLSMDTSDQLSKLSMDTSDKLLRMEEQLAKLSIDTSDKLLKLAAAGFSGLFALGLYTNAKFDKLGDDTKRALEKQGDDTKRALEKQTGDTKMALEKMEAKLDKIGKWWLWQ